MTRSSRHISLAGDSIFDNDGYVPGEPGVIEQIRMSMPNDWSAIKIAVDGDCIRHVYKRVEEFPDYLTDLVISIGGNDAMGYSHLLKDAKSLADIPRLTQGPASEFRANYAVLMDHLLRLDCALHVCTVYQNIPFPDPLWRTAVPIALAEFNKVIQEEAGIRKIPVIHLHEICVSDEDYSIVSPIEPSAIGGQKIVDGIIDHLSN